MERSAAAIAHEDGLALFIEPTWRPRCRESLADPRLRLRLQAKLYHFRHLDPRYTTAVAPAVPAPRMSRVIVPPLTAEIVIANAGWHPRYAEILVIATDGAYAVSIVDGNSDRSDIDVGMWEFEDGNWQEHSSWGAFGEPMVEPWTSGWGGLVGAACEIHGYAPGRSSVDITLWGVAHHVAVGANGYWAFIEATTDWPDEESPETAAQARMVYGDGHLIEEAEGNAD